VAALSDVRGAGLTATGLDGAGPAELRRAVALALELLAIVGTAGRIVDETTGVPDRAATLGRDAGAAGVAVGALVRGSAAKVGRADRVAGIVNESAERASLAAVPLRLMPTATTAQPATATEATRPPRIRPTDM
jgi:hypothetical protein